MVDRKAKIQALLAQQEEERKHLFEHADRLDALEGIIGEKLIHKMKLGYFGKTPHLYMGSSVGGKDQPNINMVARLGNLLKPEPMAIVRRSCTSVTAKELVDVDDVGRMQEIAPMVIKFEPHGAEHAPRGVTMEWNWYTRVNGELWEVSIHTDLDERFGSISYEWSYSPHQVNRYLTGTKFHRSYEPIIRKGKVLTAITGPAESLKWYAGEGYANAYTLYWPLKGGQRATIPAIISSIINGYVLA